MRSQAIRTLATASSGATNAPKLSVADKAKLARILRVNHAGEIGADYIYRGQLWALRNDPKVAPIIQHMWEQEKKHLRTFDDVLGANRVRPSALRPLWEAAGFALGAATGLIGKEAAMACTEAVETVIGQHYNDQLRDLMTMEDSEGVKELQQVVKQFRDEELEHLDTAVELDSKKAPLHSALNFVIQTGCRAAIWIAKRV
ncbi:ubiquinone biosynthesis protein coq7 [Cladochytrium replicatum]|nr:ubiquinone biosynthesis protein coq7 [Cladochytrium replicatum]